MTVTQESIKHGSCETVGRLLVRAKGWIVFVCKE